MPGQNAISTMSDGFRSNPRLVTMKRPPPRGASLQPPQLPPQASRVRQSRNRKWNRKPLPKSSLPRLHLTFHGKSIIIYVGEVLILLLVLLLLLMLFLFCRNRLRHRAYSQLCAAEKLEAGMKKALYLGELQGIWLEKGETLSSYGKRAGGILDTPIRVYVLGVYRHQRSRYKKRSFIHKCWRNSISSAAAG